jgi:hypothetical protein
MNNQFAGNLGYHGYSLNPNYNKLVDEANKLVDKYNTNVSKLPKTKQMGYQQKTLNKIKNILHQNENE